MHSWQISFTVIISSHLSFSLSVSPCGGCIRKVSPQISLHNANQIVPTICFPAKCIIRHGVFLRDIHLRSNPLKLPPLMGLMGGSGQLLDELLRKDYDWRWCNVEKKKGSKSFVAKTNHNTPIAYGVRFRLARVCFFSWRIHAFVFMHLMK